MFETENERQYDDSISRSSASAVQDRPGADNYTREGESPWDFRDPKESVWAGWQGIAVMLFGVIMPALIIVSGLVASYDRIVLLLWKQPVETVVEVALLLTVPFANLVVWNALCKNDCRHTVRRGILNGIAIGTTAVVSAITGIAAVLRFPTLSEAGVPHVFEFALICMLSLLAMTVGINLAYRSRQIWVTKSSKARAASFVAFGVLLSVFGFVAAEARSTCIRAAEYLATCDNIEDRRRGIDFLKLLNPEKQIRMECSSRKAGGLPGLFIRVDNDTLRQLHFAITGKTFGDEQSQNFASMTDEYLKNHVVGDPVPGLSLQKSAMFGQVDPTTVSSTVYWTFVFKNKNYEPQEARAEIGLPEGAVVSGMTVWKDGRPLQTEFQPTAEQSNSSWTNIGHDAPGIVTDLGRGRMLLHCYPVPAQGRLRMSIAVTVPLKLHTISDTTLALPRFIETNFDLKGSHSVRIMSDNEISLSMKGIKTAKAANGQHLIDGAFSTEALSGAGVAVRVKRPPVYGPIAIRDESVKPFKYLVQTIRELPAAQPQHLVVVLDSSESMKPHLSGLKKALSNLPAGITASLVVASQNAEERPTVLDMKTGLGRLSDKNFTGGQDNLEAVIAATSVAGESKRGAVLWIHGPQPGYNKEIYIMSPYMYMPSFYELALDDGVMDAGEYFKNHREIGPFTEIARSASIESDLERFLTKWRPGGHDYVVEYQVLSKQPDATKLVTGEQAQQTAALFARERVSQLLRAGQLKDAIDMAVYHRIVTPVSLASCTGSGQSLESERLAYEHGTRNVRIVDGSAGNAGPPQQQRQHITTSAPGNNSYYNTTGCTTADNSSTTEDCTSLKGSNKYEAPILQGANNGTIGPQGVSVMGVNTAGTVRVNNLANLEALLNIFANFLQIGGIAIGGSFVVSSAFAPIKEGQSLLLWGRLSQPARFAIGALILGGGLLAPGFVNYMVASARDANVFS